MERLHGVSTMLSSRRLLGTRDTRGRAAITHLCSDRPLVSDGELTSIIHGCSTTNCCGGWTCSHAIRAAAESRPKCRSQSSQARRPTQPVGPGARSQVPGGVALLAVGGRGWSWVGGCERAVLPSAVCGQPPCPLPPAAAPESGWEPCWGERSGLGARSTPFLLPETTTTAPPNTNPSPASLVALLSPLRLPLESGQWFRGRCRVEQFHGCGGWSALCLSALPFTTSYES